MLRRGKESFVPLPNAVKPESRGGSLCCQRNLQSGDQANLQVGFGTNTEDQA